MNTDPESNTPIVEKSQIPDGPSQKTVELAKDIGRYLGQAAATEAQTDPDNPNRTEYPDVGDIMQAAEAFTGASEGGKPIIEEQNKRVLPETPEERRLADRMIKAGVRVAGKIGAVINFKRGLEAKKDPRKDALVEGMVNFYVNELKKGAEIPAMAGGSEEVEPEKKPRTKKESLDRLFDPNLKVALVKEEDLPHILSRMRSLSGRRVALDVTPTQLARLARGEVPQGIDPSKGDMLIRLVSGLGVGRIAPFSSYASTEDDRQIYEKDLEDHAQGKNLEMPEHYAAKGYQRIANEARRIVWPFVSADGWKRLDITKPEDNTIVLFSNAQVLNPGDEPVKPEELLGFVRNVLGESGGAIVGTEIDRADQVQMPVKPAA